MRPMLGRMPIPWVMAAAWPAASASDWAASDAAAADWVAAAWDAEAWPAAKG